MSAKQYPKSEGWLHASLSLKRDATMTEEEAKTFLSRGKPDDYEFGPITQRGNTVKAIYREKNWQERVQRKPEAVS